MFFSLSVRKLFLYTLLFISTIHAASASVILIGTRIIYPSDKQTVDLKFRSSDNVPSVINIWINRKETSSGSDDAPFVVTPSIFRIDPNKGQSAKLMFTGGDLPGDRETLFFLNFVQLPASSKNENKLLVSYKSTVKLFYRPTGLGYDSEKLDTYLKADLRNLSVGEISITNNSPFYITPTKLQIAKNGKVISLNQETELSMIKPFSSNVFRVKPYSNASDVALSISLINDLGGISTYKITLK
ncbi:molecular chaperone [Erwiniaceae bacterium CAU 1747]